MAHHPSLAELIERYPCLHPCEGSLYAALDALKNTFANGGKVLLCGNGGSNADCDHIAGELMKSFLLPHPIPTALKESLAAQDNPHSTEIAKLLQGGLPAISLGNHTALGSAVSNDTCATMIFAQQVYALGKSGDLLWGISTSGNSVNVLRAVLTAKALDIKTMGLTGAHGGKLGELCDVAIRVPADRVDIIQELHLPVYHALCAAVEEIFFGE